MFTRLSGELIDPLAAIMKSSSSFTTVACDRGDNTSPNWRYRQRLLTRNML